MTAQPQARPTAAATPAPAVAAPAGPDSALMRETARRYDLCHPADSFNDLTRRAAFSKEDRRLRQDWLEAVRRDREAGHA